MTTRLQLGLADGPSQFLSQAGSAGATVPQLTREERLSRLAEIDPEGARPGLAVCRALTAAYGVGAGEPGAQDELSAALVEAVEAIGGTRG